MTKKDSSKTKSNAKGRKEPSDNQPPSFKVADPEPPNSVLDSNVSQLVRDALEKSEDARQAAAQLIDRMLGDNDFEVFTPAELLANREIEHDDEDEDEDFDGVEDNEMAIDTLTFSLGNQGKYLGDADLVVREIDKGYAVAVIWVTNALADDAERIAFWAGQISLATSMDMTVCVVTLNDQSSYPPAETERREAMVCYSVHKAYWFGEGHPQDERLTRFADLLEDVSVSRNSVLHL